MKTMSWLLTSCLVLLSVGVWLLAEAVDHGGDSLAVAGWIAITSAFICLWHVKDDDDQ